jgi:hypothetical protein
MARKSQHKHQGPGLVGGHYPAQQESATGGDRADTIAKAKAIEELVAPVLSYPFTATYTSELEISAFEDTLSTIAEIAIRTTAKDQEYLSHQNQIQYSYATAAWSWDQQSQTQQGRCSSQNQIPFDVWENQSPVEEPFNDIGEVPFELAGRRQGDGYDGRLRRGKRQKKGQLLKDT